MRDDHDAIANEAPGLTPPYAEFRMNNPRVILCLVISGVVAVACLGIILLGFVFAFPEPVINKRILTILLGACGLVLALILFVSNWRKYGQRVVIFAEGYRFYRRGTWSVVRWDDVVAVWRHSATIGSSLVLVETNLWVQTSDGKTAYLNSFFLDMAKLVEIVLTETARRLVPSMSSQLRRGETVDFGKLQISATELVASGKALAWADVEAIQVAYGAIDVRQKDRGSWYYTRIKDMPNYHVFLALAESLQLAAGPMRSTNGAS